jgi:hypothetical protein
VALSSAAAVIALFVLAACSSSGTATKKVADQAAPTSTMPGPTPSGADVAASQAARAAATPSRAGSGSTPTHAATTTTRPAERLTSGSRLRVDGIGPLTVGMSLSQASAAAGTTVGLTSADFGTGCRYAEAAKGPTGLSFMVVGGRIVRFDVGGPPDQPPSTIATLSGIRVGSSENDVMAAYPGRIRVTGHPYLETGHYLIYTPANRALSLVFETDGRRVTSFRSGQAAAVSAIEGCL